MQINIIFWVIFAALISALPVTIIESYINNKKTFLLFLTLCCYILLIICYLNIFKIKSIITYYLLIKVLADVIVIFSGIVFFKEVITIKQFIGILFAFLAMYFISA
jgi:drug/metabolite transporter (DMT)-like permease